MSGNGNGGSGKDTRQFVRDLREGDLVQGTFAVRSKESPRDYRSKPGRFFFMEVGDRTGDIGVKFWGGKDPALTLEVYKSISPGDVVFVTGTVQEDRFEERLVISVDEAANVLRPSTEEVRVEDYLPTSRQDLEGLMARVMEVVSSVKEPNLRALLDSFFGDADFREEFKRIPSAVVHHHNYIGGNLEHVVGVVEVSETICRVHPDLDRDLLMTGALLHDIGKMRTYTYSTFIDMTDEGRFMSHAILGEMMVRDRVKAIDGFPPVLAMKLSHMILKHMGSYEENGISGMRTAEALALHLADNADAQVKEFLQEVDKGRALGEEKWYYSRTFKGPVHMG